MDGYRVTQDLGIQLSYLAASVWWRLKTETEFRETTALERALLERLLEADFPGKSQLVPLVRNVLVRTIDDDGGLEIRCQIEGTAPVVKRVPVEAEGKDDDGVVIHMLLHVVDGRPVELEFFREDAGAVKKIPHPSVFELIVLPPMPEKGWLNS
jgi:hypothetical protein